MYPYVLTGGNYRVMLAIWGIDMDLQKADIAASWLIQLLQYLRQLPYQLEQRCGQP